MERVQVESWTVTGEHVRTVAGRRRILQEREGWRTMRVCDGDQAASASIKVGDSGGKMVVGSRDGVDQ